VIGRHEVNFPAVLVDNIGGATLAVQHLADIGHRRIGFIGGPEASTTGADRLRGYQSALAQNGYPLEAQWIRLGNLTPRSGYEAAKKLLGERERPTALFAANDLMAFGAVYAARERKLRIPQEIAVIGFDNIPLSSYLVPSLTTVEIPMHSLGLAAMETLIDLISGKPFEWMRWFKTQLIVRGSTAPERL
jgi:LacI family transcriptional regulator